jgi:hypothetical protein
MQEAKQKGITAATTKDLRKEYKLNNGFFNEIVFTNVKRRQTNTNYTL